MTSLPLVGAGGGTFGGMPALTAAKPALAVGSPRAATAWNRSTELTQHVTAAKRILGGPVGEGSTGKISRPQILSTSRC